jgi:hypothetical protein
MSLLPEQIPAVRPGNRLRVSAEVQVSTTCTVQSPRCVGNPYDFTPRVTARLLLTNGPDVTGGNHAYPLDNRRMVQCRQRRPNRNHHCTLVFDWSATRLTNDLDLPGRPREFYVNLVMDASNRRSKPGDFVVVGGDRPDGTIAQDKGRVNAVLIRHWSTSKPLRYSSATPTATQLPLGQKVDPSARVTYSVPLPDLRAGDKLTASADQLTDIAGLGYPVFLSSELVLADAPDATIPGPVSREVSSYRGRLDEANGFNCTQGLSAYTTPCVTRKVGVIHIRRDPPPGTNLYINLVSRGKALLNTPDPADFATVLPEGHLTVVRYPR